MGGGGGVPTSNLDDGRGTAFLAVAWALAALAAIIALLRLYCRLFRRPFAGFDDFCAVVALALALGGTAAITWQVHYGFGGRWEALPDDYRNATIKWQYIAELLCWFAVSFIRASVCLYVLRLTPVLAPSRWLACTAYVVLAFGVVTTLSTVIAASLTCIPLGAIWSSGSISCIRWGQMMHGIIATSCLEIIANLATLILPVALLRDRTLTCWQRTHLLILFSLGLVPFASSIARVVMQTRVDRDDSTYDNLVPAYFAVLEMDFGIIAACLACLGSLFPSCWPRSPTPPALRNESCIETGAPDSPIASISSKGSISSNIGPLPSPVKPCRCIIDSSAASLAPPRRFQLARSFASVRAWPVRPWLRLRGSTSQEYGNGLLGSRHSHEDFSRSGSLGVFPDLVPQIGRSSVVKRMDVQVELSKATDNEIALTDKEMYASWEDPPDDPDAIEPLGSSNLKASSRGLGGCRRGSAARPGSRPVVRSYNTAVAEALEVPPCAYHTKSAERSWWRG